MKTGVIMKKILLRVDIDVDAEVSKYSKDHGIHNMQAAYRRLILSGLSQETKFDKTKRIIFENETIKELKVISNILAQTVSSVEQVEDIRGKTTEWLNSVKIIKEL
jgi:hypothetical protein